MYSPEVVLAEVVVLMVILEPEPCLVLLRRTADGEGGEL